MVQTEKKLHLGCGLINIPGWINIDLDSSAADQCLDLTRPLPFEDSSVTHIFSEHFIEHITREQGVAFLKECHRVLTPEGAIRISTPSLRFLAHCYFSGSKNEWEDLWKPSTECQMMNEGMRAWGHQFVYDAEELTRVMSEAGFRNIAFQMYRQSTDDIFAGLESRPFHNELIVEARKTFSMDVKIDFSAVAENESIWNSHCIMNAQANERVLVKITAEKTAQAELIESLGAHVRELEADIAAREQATAGIAKESAERAELIEKLNTHIRELENALKLFESSWYWRMKSFFRLAVK